MIHQKQPPEVFYEKSCSRKSHKVHRKIPVPESLFNKVVGLRPATKVFTVLVSKPMEQINS